MTIEKQNTVKESRYRVDYEVPLEIRLEYIETKGRFSVFAGFLGHSFSLPIYPEISGSDPEKNAIDQTLQYLFETNEYGEKHIDALFDRCENPFERRTIELEDFEEIE